MLYMAVLLKAFGCLSARSSEKITVTRLQHSNLFLEVVTSQESSP